MDIKTAKAVLLRTHLAALRTKTRASGYHLESGPGMGKSDAQYQYAADLARAIQRPVGLVVFMLATIASVDMKGFMLPVKNANSSIPDTVFSIPPWYPVATNTHVFTPEGEHFRPGEWTGDHPDVGILFLDEFSQAEDDVKKPAAELVYKGEVGTSRLGDGWRVVSAGNRLTDRSGVLRELMFIVNRRNKISVDPSLPAWLEWANELPPEHRPHYLTMSFAQKNPDVVFKDAIPAGSDPFCTPRTLCLLDNDLKALRTAADEAADRLPLDPVAREVAAGWIGAAAAAQFYTHMKYFDELPEFDDVAKRPDRAKLPSAKDAQMVCAYMLAHHVTGPTAGSVIQYLHRMHIEMQVLAVRAIMAQQARATAIVSNKGFIDWLSKHQEVLIASRI